MQRLLYAVLACFISFNVHGQADIKDTLINLKNYSVLYSQKYLQPIEVWFKVKCPKNNKRGDDCRDYFTKAIADSLGVNTSKHKHYKGNSWDKGHMASIESFDCSCDDVEETLTYLNCALQNDSLNQKVWKDLEDKERELAEIHNVFVYIKVEFENSVKIDSVRIPSGFYKTLIVDGESSSYYFRNTTPKSNNLEHYKID